MKKLIIITGLLMVSVSCKSDIEKEIEQYDLNKAKLQYLEALMKTREDLTFRENQRLIDSMITAEKNRINDNNN